MFFRAKAIRGKACIFVFFLSHAKAQRTQNYYCNKRPSMIVVKNGSILKQTATFHCHFLMPKSNQKAFAKSKAIFNLIFLRKRLKPLIK